MKSFREMRYSKGWVVSLATVIGLGLGGYTYVQHALASQVYVTNCGMQDFKPSTVIKFCADAGVSVNKISWSVWNEQGATGEGEYQINDCEPSCVDGKHHYAKVVISLSKVKEINGKTTLTYIDIKTKDGKNLPLSDSAEDAWPMELAG